MYPAPPVTRMALFAESANANCTFPELRRLPRRTFYDMSTFTQDLRLALRMLLKSPGFTAVAVAALALGIGANTAIFSVVNGVLLQPLPFKDANRLMQLGRKFPDGVGNSTSIPKYTTWKQHNQAF